MGNRIAIFIDGAYIQSVLAEEFNRARIDFAKLSQAMAQGEEILRTYYYHCLPYRSDPPTPDEEDRYARRRGFYAALELLPRFEVRLGRLEFRGNEPDGRPRFEQKRVDILLGVDMVQLSAKGQIRQAVLLAGDSDFIPAVAAAKSEGVLVRLYHGSHCHSDLLREVDERVKIDQDFINQALREQD